MQEPIVFVTVTIKGGYSVTINLNHIKFITMPGDNKRVHISLRQR